eukprot:12913559-Prorocentrum_lima.AAC.1
MQGRQGSAVRGEADGALGEALGDPDFAIAADLARRFALGSTRCLKRRPLGRCPRFLASRRFGEWATTSRHRKGL